jgi:hypothetical protein
VQVTLSATSAFLGLGAVSFTGVSQGTPHGTPVTATSFTPGTASVTAAAAVGDLVLDTCWTTCCAPMVPDAAQTVQVNVYDGATTGQSLGLSTKPGAASVLMAWTGIQAQWTLMALPIHP